MTKYMTAKGIEESFAELEEDYKDLCALIEKHRQELMEKVQFHIAQRYKERLEKCTLPEPQYIRGEGEEPGAINIVKECLEK